MIIYFDNEHTFQFNGDSRDNFDWFIKSRENRKA